MERREIFEQRKSDLRNISTAYSIIANRTELSDVQKADFLSVTNVLHVLDLETEKKETKEKEPEKKETKTLDDSVF